MNLHFIETIEQKTNKTMAPLFALVLCFIGLMAAPSFAQPGAEQQEIQRLCAKWDGIVVLSTRPDARLRCEKIRDQFVSLTKNGTLFKNIKVMLLSIRNNDLREMRSADFPKDQKCTLSKGREILVTCKTVSEPEISTQLIGSKDGRLQKAIVTADLDWFRKDLTKKSLNSYGTPPTDEFLNFYTDLMVAVNSHLGGTDERYRLLGKMLVATFQEQ